MFHQLVPGPQQMSSVGFIRGALQHYCLPCVPILMQKFSVPYSSGRTGKCTSSVATAGHGPSCFKMLPTCFVLIYFVYICYEASASSRKGVAAFETALTIDPSVLFWLRSQLKSLLHAVGPDVLQDIVFNPCIFISQSLSHNEKVMQFQTNYVFEIRSFSRKIWHCCFLVYV